MLRMHAEDFKMPGNFLFVVKMKILTSPLHCEHESNSC